MSAPMSVIQPSDQYKRKLTNPGAAVEAIRDGSTLCVALGVGAPPALTRAVADRVLAGNLKDLHLVYQHAMRPMAESLIRPEVLARIDARNFFIGEPDREMIQRGIAEGRKYLSYIPCNFSQIPRALTESMRVDTFLVTVSPMDASGHFSLGTNNDYASTVVRPPPACFALVHQARLDPLQPQLRLHRRRSGQQRPDSTHHR